MSRVELDAIQTKLKAAILNHQMLVKKMKGDKQNSSIKSGLSDVQEEIKRLSEEQKKIVVKLRETLVKSTSLPVQPHASTAIPVLTMGQTITAIGQPRLVSFSSQGGATILPVGMLAVPIAHVQRPTLGVTLNPGGQMCAQANLSLQPADYANAVAAGTQIPAGIFNSGQAIPINSSIALQNSIAINNITSAINVSSLNGGLSLHNLNGGVNLNSLNTNSVNNIIGSGVAAAAQSVASVITSKVRPQVNTTNVSSCSSHGTVFVTQTSSVSTVCNISAASVNSSNKSGNAPVSSTSTFDDVAPNIPVSVSMTASTQALVVNEQPLVQPHLLQQQQQQILQMIQLQQPPQQRLASHFPIKVPQYTASPIRTIVSSTSVQYCNIAPAPMPFVSTCSVKPSVIPTPAVVNPKVETPKALLGTSLTSAKEIKLEKQDQGDSASIKKISADDKKKLQFMQALDLYTPDALRELLSKRNERKRRTTANPQYSIGFESNRRHRNISSWEDYPIKRARVTKSWKGNGHSGDRAGVLSQNGNCRAADNHEDFCAACGKGGRLLMCETCRLVYHLDCLKPPLTEAPKYAWSCPKCLVSGKGSAQLSSEALSRVHSYIGKRASKEDERKKLQRKRNEINYEKSFLDSRSKKLEIEMKDKKSLKTRLEEKENESKKKLQELSELIQSVRQSHSSTSVSCLSPANSDSVQLPLSSSAVSNTTQDILSSKNISETPDGGHNNEVNCDNIINPQAKGSDLVNTDEEHNSSKHESNVSNDEVMDLKTNGSISVACTSVIVSKESSDFQITTSETPTTSAAILCRGEEQQEMSLGSGVSL